MSCLPLTHPEFTEIGGSGFSFAVFDDRMVYFSDFKPFDCHAEADRSALRLRIARFALHGIAHRHLQAAFGVSRTTVHRALVQLRERDEASFHAPPRGRGPGVLVGEKADRAKRLLASGKSGAAVARELGVAVATVNHNRRRGFLGGEAKRSRTEAAPEEALDRGGRERRDRAAAMGRGARDRAGRVAASAGNGGEARPRFDQPLKAVAGGGVLAALPMLLREGLLHRAREFLSLPKGYYGVTSTLLLLAFLTLARARSLESLRHRAPGEWGALLGLDRCPEVKTLRRKLGALAGDGSPVKGWQDALVKRWLEERPEARAPLAVDGHVKVYSGRKGKLPKHFVSRQRLCLPASTSYWVNALGGAPLLCLHEALDPRLAGALERDVLPALERAGVLPADAPDLSAGAGTPALTLVFDREGWSPTLFARLARRGVAVITWRKGAREADWPEAEFRPAPAPVQSPGGVRLVETLLAERPTRLADGLAARRVRRRMDDGRQAEAITTHPHLPVEEVAGALLSRWSQENFFKYMREEFHFDSLPTRGLAAPDPQARVVNPAWRELDREWRRLRTRIGALRARLSEGPPKETARRLREESAALEEKREALRPRRKETRKHVKMAELDPDDRPDALPDGERLLLDLIRMIAYRAETRMTPAIADAQGREPRPRRPLRALFQADADLLPDPRRGLLRVRLLGLASPAADAALRGLLDELNQTRTAFPGTNLRMVYELP